MTDFFFLHKIDAFITSLFVIKLLRLESKRNLKIAMCFYRRWQIVWRNFVKLNCLNSAYNTYGFSLSQAKPRWKLNWIPFYARLPNTYGYYKYTSHCMKVCHCKVLLCYYFQSVFLLTTSRIYSSELFNCKASRLGMSHRRCGFYLIAALRIKLR